MLRHIIVKLAKTKYKKSWKQTEKNDLLCNGKKSHVNPKFYNEPNYHLEMKA